MAAAIQADSSTWPRCAASQLSMSAWQRRIDRSAVLRPLRSMAHYHSGHLSHDRLSAFDHCTTLVPALDVYAGVTRSVLSLTHCW